jgi:PAS domain S-box-containing protein
MPTSLNNTKSDLAPSSSRESSLSALPDTPWSLVFDALPDAISIHTSSSDIVWANRALCELYGKTLSELKGMTCSEAFHEGNSDCPHERVANGGQSVQSVDDLVVSGRAFSVSFEPLFDAGNKQQGFIRVMGDVSEARNAHLQLLKAERFATLGQLLTGVAHDVGTPLNVISGYAEFLMMRKNPGDQGYKELTSILDQTRRIAAIFGQALELARPAQGGTDAIDLKAIIEESLSLAGPHLRKTNVTASLTCRIPKPLIYGEASQLKQAFFIILLNTGRRVGTGGSLRAIIDEAQKMPEFLELVLLGTEANGVSHDSSMLFKEGLAVQGEGSGIGLSLARKILAEAGARICFTPAGEEAAGLVLQLPRNEAAVGRVRE